MGEQKTAADIAELNALCSKVRELVGTRDYQSCISIIVSAMSKYPHAPQPHNLLGVLLERQGDHLTAMKHFRAAWALDATYLPARQNLDCYGTFFSHGKCAFDESDCPEEKHDDYKIEYDAHGIGHVVRRT